MYNEEENRTDGYNSGEINFAPPIDFNIIGDGEKTAKSIISRSLLAAFVYLLSCRLCVIVLQYLMIAIFGIERAAVLLSDYSVSIILTSLIQYGIGFPIFYLTICKVKPTRGIEKSKMKPSTIVVVFLICQAAMVIGNYIGQSANIFISDFLGSMPENSVSTVVDEVPLYLLIPSVVILAPIFEELMFRKLMIDRLSYVGDVWAVIISALAFGLFHTNLYQFFYATLIGFIFGYVYAKTRKLIYTVILHMAVNFFGSVVSIPASEASDKFIELVTLIESGAEFVIADYIAPLTIFLSYVFVQYSMAIAGIIILVVFIAKGGLNGFGKKKEIYLPSNKLALISFSNPGAILFLIVTFVLTLESIITSLLPM